MPQAQESDYSRTKVVEICDRVRASMDELVSKYPELMLVKDKFDEIVLDDADPLQQMSGLFEACREVFVGLRYLLNPIGLPVRLTPDGRVLTHTFHEVAAFVTDIRGFTEMTRNVEDQWDQNVFDVLSYCYFPHVVDVLERHGCHYLNYTGDGLLVLSLGRHDANRRIVIPSLDNAVLCALEMTTVTNCIAETWRQMGLVQGHGAWHETGLGLTSGSVQVGDPFVPDREPSGKLAEFDGAFRRQVAGSAPYFKPRQEYTRRLVAIHALSAVINRASRLQDADKQAPEHTCMMTGADVAQLCPPLQQLFVRVGQMYLKGIGDTDVYGFHRFTAIDVPDAEQQCRAYYASRQN